MNSILITGGCGFIGCNAAVYFKKKGWNVTLLDNLSRGGTEKNLDWLQSQGQFEFLKIDIRDHAQLEQVFSKKKYDFVLHLAGQVAVTTSVVNPREDFEINALGTLNVLESVRKHHPNAFVLYSSTNKVYGKLDSIGTKEGTEEYSYADCPSGIDEKSPLDFYSPYGCSKGAADQYVLDYARIYGLKTVVFRQSCIYGIRQFGIEDQGWIAWFAIASMLGKKISIYGDGKQVRDALNVQDLVQAYEVSYLQRDRVQGQAFNIGGGVKNTLSLLKLVGILEKQLKINLKPHFADWRPGDQKVFICDISKFSQLTGWRPEISVEQGVAGLIDWIQENRSVLESVLK